MKRLVGLRVDDSMPLRGCKPPAKGFDAGIFKPRQTRLSVRRVVPQNALPTLVFFDMHCDFVCDQTQSRAMDFQEEPFQNTVDPEVRAYVYSLVSAVS